MQIDELKAKVNKQRESLKTKSGVPISGPNGPLSSSMLDALVETLEAQDKRIAALEAIAEQPVASEPVPGCFDPAAPAK